ncbi:MAG TPA: 50S ribosomal protein L25 [Clostridia bacterium]|nr:50S ribosomal protein L25 [Clostridia bacterium]
MKDIILKAEKREIGSTPELKKLRREGMVPAVVYGKHSDNRSIKIADNEVKRYDDSMASGSSMKIQMGEEKVMVIVKEVQRDAVLRNVIHIDFQELTEGEKIKVKIPVHLFNRDAVEGGNMVVQQQLNEIEIETLPKDLIQSVDIDCKLLRDTETITVADLPVFNSEDIEVLADPEEVVVTLVIASRAESDEEEAEEGVEEEVAEEE